MDDSGMHLDEQETLSLTPRLIAVKIARERQETVLTVSLCRSLIHRLIVRRVGVTEIDTCEGRKTVETVSGSVLSLFHRDGSRC
jgi:hypothetical protein